MLNLQQETLLFLQDYEDRPTVKSLNDVFNFQNKVLSTGRKH